MKLGADSLRYRAFLLGLLVALPLLLAACTGGGGGGDQQTAGPTTEPSPTPVPVFDGEVVVYVVGPLSGPNAQRGQAMAAGARLAAEELNGTGGLLGNKVLVRVINDRGEPQFALDAAQRVADAARIGDQVVGVVVYEGSDPQLESITQVYLKDGSGLSPLVIVPASTELVPASVQDQRFFRLSAPSLSQASEAATVFQEGNLLNVIVIHSSTPYGNQLADEFDKAAAGLDVEVVGRFEILPPNAASYTDLVKEVREINPSALFFAAGEAEAAVFLSELIGFEFTGSVYGADRALSYTVIDELGCQAEGLRFVSLLPDPSVALSSEQLSRYAAQEGRAAEPYTVGGYSAVELVVEAFKKAGTLDARAAAQQAHQTGVKTLAGDLAFDAGGNVLNSKIHFFHVEGRSFSESFARVVGTPPQARQGTAGAGAALLNISYAPDKEPIVFAGLNWGSAQFINGVARIIVEGGYQIPTRSVEGASIPLFHSLRNGDVQVYMEGWLPNLEELYDKATAKQEITDLGLYFGDAVQGWFVPRYVVEGDLVRQIDPVAPQLSSVEDLERYASVFASEDRPGLGKFVDGSSGWASYRIDCMKLKAYRLDDRYAQITSGSESALFAALSDAYERGEPILTYLYEPTWPMAKFDLVQISEPAFSQDIWDRNKAVAFPLAQVKKWVHPGLPGRAPDVVEFLSKVSLTSDEISGILETMKEQDLKPEEYARVWVKEKQAVWSGWVAPDAVAKVLQALGP